MAARSTALILLTFAPQASNVSCHPAHRSPQDELLTQICLRWSPSPRRPSSNATPLPAASPPPVRRSPHASELRCTHRPHAAFTCRCEIPMQLPILYSMSSSGEVTRALQGWQRTLLQNCILKSQSQHCQSRKVSGAAVCASLFLRVS